jgi:potassium voltage-gated channel Eag-related subfamily H protein 8
MINNRLTYHLEKHSLLTPNQSGFRKGRSTTDQLVRLETFIREAFIRKHHLVAVFFDLEKAYDTTWRYGIMRDLHDLNFRGRLPRFVANYLQDRTFQLRLGTTFSDLFQQENGVPQGSI